MRTDFDFDLRCVRFVIDRRELYAKVTEVYSRLTDLLKECKESNNDKIEGIVREIVLNFRPNLGGCCIWRLEFGLDPARFIVTVSHQLLDSHAYMEYPKTQWLDPLREEVSPYSNDSPCERR